MTKFYPVMTHSKYDQFLAEYMKDEDCDFLVNSDNGEDQIGYDEDGNVLFHLVPNVFNDDDFKIYDILDEVAESNLNTNRGASAGEVDRDLVGWGKKDNVEAVKNVYKQVSKYALSRTNPNNPKVSYRISNPVNSNMIGYFDKADINCRKFIKNPPKCRLTSYTQKNFEKYKQVIPYVEKISEVMKRVLPSKYQNHINFIKNKDKIGDSAFTTLTINKNFKTAIHTDSGDYKNGIGVLTCMGEFKGGRFCFPNYKIQIDLKPTDVLFANVHRHHCNTDIEGNRISVVSYIRERMDRCDDVIDYKIVIQDERLLESLTENKIDLSKVYLLTDSIASSSNLRWDGVNLINENPKTFFKSYTPILYYNDIIETDDFEDTIIKNFELLFKSKSNQLYWGESIFEINQTETAETLSTLIDDRLTPFIIENIKGWKKLGYKVKIYSFIDLSNEYNDDEWEYASTIVDDCIDKYFFVMNLLSKQETIFIDNDVLLLGRLPEDPIIITSEFNRNNVASPNLAVFKMPKDNVFLKDACKFLGLASGTNDNKRKFMRCLNYFALAKYILNPSYFCKINKIYAKSIFIDYEKYKTQEIKYDLNIPLIEDLSNCIGIKCNNINQVIKSGSLYSLLYSQLP